MPIPQKHRKAAAALIGSLQPTKGTEKDQGASGSSAASKVFKQAPRSKCFVSGEAALPGAKPVQQPHNMARNQVFGAKAASKTEPAEFKLSINADLARTAHRISGRIGECYPVDKSVPRDMEEAESLHNASKVSLFLTSRKSGNGTSLAAQAMAEQSLAAAGVTPADEIDLRIEEDNSEVIETMRNKVHRLINDLHTDDRQQIMTNLNYWFEKRLQLIPEDNKVLAQWDEDVTIDEDEFSLARGAYKVEIRQKATAKDAQLNKLDVTLKEISRRGVESAKEKVQAEEELRRNAEELIIDENQLEDLKAEIGDLGQQFLAKQEAHNEQRNDAEADKEEKDLLQAIKEQQVELADLNRKADVSHQRVLTLRTALEYVSSGGVGVGAEDGVLDTIEEIKMCIRKDRLSKDLRKADAENPSALEAIDDSEIQQLQAECDALEEQVSDMNAELERLGDPSQIELALQERIDAIGGNAGGSVAGAPPDIRPEDAKQLEVDFLDELGVIQGINEAVYQKLAEYDTLMKNGEMSLKRMDMEKNKFLEIVGKAKNGLGNTETLEDALRNSGLDEAEMVKREKELASLVAKEEKEMCKGIDQIEMGVGASLLAIADERRRARELGWEWDRQKEEGDSLGVERGTVSKASLRILKLLEVNEGPGMDLEKRMELYRKRLQTEKSYFNKVKSSDNAKVTSRFRKAADPLSPKNATEGDDSPIRRGRYRTVQEKEIAKCMQLHAANVELVEQLDDLEGRFKELKGACANPLESDLVSNRMLKLGFDITACTVEEILSSTQQKLQAFISTRESVWAEHHQAARPVRRGGSRSSRGSRHRPSILVDPSTADLMRASTVSPGSSGGFSTPTGSPSSSSLRKTRRTSALYLSGAFDSSGPSAARTPSPSAGCQLSSSDTLSPGGARGSHMSSMPLRAVQEHRESRRDTLDINDASELMSPKSPRNPWRPQGSEPSSPRESRRSKSRSVKGSEVSEEGPEAQEKRRKASKRDSGEAAPMGGASEDPPADAS